MFCTVLLYSTLFEKMKEDVKTLLLKGYLVEQETANILGDTFEEIFMTDIILQLNPPKIITKDFFNKNIEFIVKKLEADKIKTENLERIKKYFSAFLEIKKEETQPETTDEKKIEMFEKERKRKVEIIEAYEFPSRKISVEDFVKYFRDRYFVLKSLLQERDLEGLSSIGKISGQRRLLSVIGLVYDKRYTKNKNLLLEIEDLTGRIPIVVHREKTELFEKAQNIVLDEVVAIKGAGSREIMFANDIIFPDIGIEKKRAPFEHYAAFTADLHVGSNKFLEQNFLRFIDWLNGNLGSKEQKELAKKVKYLFIVGDTVDGVGVYPKQERELKIKDIREQYKLLAEYLRRIRKDITILMCAGGMHDAGSLIEPHHKISKEIAPELHQIDNLILTTNPATVKIGKTKNFPGLNVLMYHGDSYDLYYTAVDSLRQNNANLKPDLMIHFLLKKRHLAPTHASTTYYPYEKDFLTIRNVPDIYVSGHIHRSAISNYNGILTISCSCWQSKTTYQEKFGHEPDPCKVPILNLKTGKISVMDFS